MSQSMQQFQTVKDYYSPGDVWVRRISDLVREQSVAR